MTTFRSLHDPGRLLVIPNAWDAGSARVIEACGAEAIATTSSGLAWSCGYPDGNVLPATALVPALRAIARAIRVPLTADVEAGYSDDPQAVGALVAAVIDAGAVGVNLEDGTAPPDLLCAKIEAAKLAAVRAGIDLFVNARVDVVLRRLVPAGDAIDAVADRARRYRAAGCDGIFVPGLTAPADIRAVVAAIDPLPLNVMAYPGLPPASALATLGVRRLSAGAAVASAALGLARRLATAFLRDGTSEALFEGAVGYAEMNALMAR
jgi:2-methylisocitrate lyase-like PEP mutase family enzyme